MPEKSGSCRVSHRCSHGWWGLARTGDGGLSLGLGEPGQGRQAVRGFVHLALWLRRGGDRGAEVGCPGGGEMCSGCLAEVTVAPVESCLCPAGNIRDRHFLLGQLTHASLLTWYSSSVCWSLSVCVSLSLCVRVYLRLPPSLLTHSLSWAECVAVRICSPICPSACRLRMCQRLVVG